LSKEEVPPEYAPPREARRVETLGLWSARLSLDADIHEISAGGLGMRLPFNPQVGTEYSLSLTLFEQNFDAVAIVRDVQRREDGEGLPTYIVGMEFMQIDAAQRDLLQKFVAARLRRG
jgi:c-di-GMP-binding flagellar brake protein YcgR